MGRLKSVCLLTLFVAVSAVTVNCGGPELPGVAVADSSKYHKGTVHRYANGDFMRSIWYTYAYAPPGRDLVYKVQVPPRSNLKVTAMFAELWTGASYQKRLLNVSIDGALLESNMDVFKRAGGLHKHLSVYREYFSSSGVVQVRVSSVAGKAMMNGLNVTTTAVPKANFHKARSTNSGMREMIIPRLKANKDDDTDTEQEPKKGKIKAPKKKTSAKSKQSINNEDSQLSRKDSLFLNCGGPKIGAIKADSPEYHSQTQGFVARFRVPGAHKSELLSQSFSSKGKDLVYTFTVPKNTSVKVRAIFAEIYRGAAKEGGRALNVHINGVLVSKTLDVWAKAGGLQKAVNLDRSFVARQGVIEVRVTGVVQNAMISAIHVYAKGAVIRAGGKLMVKKPFPKMPTSKISKPPVTQISEPKTFQINCGGPALEGLLQDDPKYYSTSPKGVANFVVAPNNSPYHSNAYGKKNDDLIYRFPVVKGSRVRVVAGFAEIWKLAAKPGTRIMNLFVNGVQIAKNLDVAAAAGGIGVEYDLQREFITKSEYVTVLVSSVKQNAFLSTVKLTVWEPMVQREEKKTGPIVPRKPKRVAPVAPKSHVKAIPIAIPIRKSRRNDIEPRSFQVNCGGPAQNGILSDDPKYYSTSPNGVGNLVVPPNTSPYHSNTYGKNRGDLVYRFPIVPGSRVRVVTGFAEVWKGALKPGTRVMDVTVNGVVLAKNLDVATETGGLSIEYDLQREFITKENFVTIVVSSVKQNAFLSTVKLTIWEPQTKAQQPRATKPEQESISIPFPRPVKKETTENYSSKTKMDRPGALPIPRVLQVNCGGPKLPGILKDDPKYYKNSPEGIGSFWVPPNTSPYHSNAYGKNRGDVVYRFPIVPGSRVRVIAGFAEIWKGALKPGTRMMNVIVNGVTVAKNLDVATESGGLGMEYNVQREFISKGNFVTLRVSSVKQNAFLSTVRLMIWEQARPATTIQKKKSVEKQPQKRLITKKDGPKIQFESLPSALQVNCGGVSIGEFVADDRKYYSRSPKGVGRFPNPPDTTPTSPYGSNSFGVNEGNLTYTFPAPSGSRVRIVVGFAEIREGAATPGARLMDVVVNDFVVSKNLDVFERAGGLRKPYDIEHEFYTKKETVTVDVISVKQNAFMSAISVYIWEKQTPMGPAVLAAIPITAPEPKALGHRNMTEVFI